MTSTSSTAALEGIYDAELNYVWCTLRRLGIAERDVEDVAHDVFVVVHRQLDAYDRARPLRPWLFGIAFRVAAQHRRKGANARELLVEADEPATSPTAEASLEAKDARATVQRALDAMDLDRRAVFVMHELDGVAIPEVATALGIPTNTAYSRLRLGREEFTSTVRRIAMRGGRP